MGASLNPSQQADDMSATDPAYGQIEPLAQYLEDMGRLVHHPVSLRKAGYVIQPLSEADIDKKRRCFKCRRLWQGKFNAQIRAPQNLPVTVLSQRPSHDAAPGGRRPNLRCTFHSGHVFKSRWTCCNAPPYSPPCAGSDEHTPWRYAPGELAKHWQYFFTPHPPRQSAARRAAVVVDCEMGVNIYGESELIRISVVDYFSQSVLLDSLVWPDVRMAHYNTKFSGVTRNQMLAAQRQKTCIFGLENVRRRLWRFIGPQTIVIGHGAQNDLTSLRWIHDRIIDTFLIEFRNRPPPPEKTEEEEGEEEGEEETAEGDEDAVETDQAPQKDAVNRDRRGGRRRKRGGELSLKGLALKRLNRTIQSNGQGHDSLEDAMSTRDILHWNVIHLSEETR